MRLLLVALALCVTGCAADTEEETADGDSAIWNGPNQLGLTVTNGLDFGNAYWMARISAMVYGSREDLMRELAAVGVQETEVLFFENKATNTEAAYLGFDDVGVLAFRGTSSIKDFLTDAMAFRRKTRIGGVHLGFDRALLSVWEDSPEVTTNGKPGEGIARHLRRRHWKVGPDGAYKPLFLTGHSLGGALAALASSYAHWDACLREKPASDPFWEARTKNIALADDCENGSIAVTALYTFGAPRVGDVTHGFFTNFASFVSNRIHTTSLFRFVHSNDFVTSVPDEGYIHPSYNRNERNGLVYLTNTGAIDVGGQSTEFLSWGWRSRILERIGDHGLDNYARKLLRYAGEAPPRPRLSPERAKNQRIMAALESPGGPPLTSVARDALPSAELQKDFDRSVINGGTREAFSWRFEGATLYVFEETFNVERRANGVSTVVTEKRSVVLDGSGKKLISGTCDESSTYWWGWYDYLDRDTSR